ncbi:exonuclease SbcCD subunit D [Carnobacterium inhibens]|uniref:Nuclease SbcCD subunit D n=2 Tax=Carnobacterium inhibens TaxID=147709 RepID=U5SB46_9LACT|nr:exonuclease SbcCD subunit D [Carnobacterium inhibens]AGY82266.1 exonuclease SbcD [Carnobacterium inhibens subsp. gilichinskyi]MBC9824409.1 exonuclease subunit SbcD [Carnobacterium inhibens]MCM3511782.1 exonuclease SbcCD subunit D [Carnobacterium inhibens]
MRLLHTADWHIGKIVNEFSMLEDQEYFLDQMIKKLKTIELDALIMAGDLYDRSMPSKEAVSLANKVLTRLIQEVNVPVLVIAGNHDSSERVEYGADLLATNRLYIEGTVKEVTRKVTIKGVNFYLLPFADYAYTRELLQVETIKSLEDATRVQIETIKKEMDPEEINVLIAHGYVINLSNDNSETTDSERPLSIGTAEYVSVELFEDFDYVALGHLHKAQKVKYDRVRYSGSLLKYSKSEARHKKQLSLVTLEKDHVEIEPIYIKPKRDMRIVKGLFDEIMEQQSEDYLFFELLDENFVIDAMNQLKRRYPNAMGLEYVAKKEREENSSIKHQEQLEKLSIQDIFADFYTHYKEKNLTDERKDIIDNILHQMERGE